MVDTDLTVASGESRTVASGATDNGDPVVVAGELVVAGEVQVKPDYQPVAAGAGGAAGGTVTQRRRTAVAAGAGGATGGALITRERTLTAAGAGGADGGVVAVQVVVPLIRRSNRTQTWNNLSERTLDAESDQ
jgi:hypothetical protein